MRIFGSTLSHYCREDLQIKAQQLRGSCIPCLKMIVVGDNPSSLAYVKSKKKVAENLGILALDVFLPKDVSAKDLDAHIQKANEDPSVHGILLQLPLPEHLNQQYFLDRISPEKDVDGLSTQNLGQLLCLNNEQLDQLCFWSEDFIAPMNNWKQWQQQMQKDQGESFLKQWQDHLTHSQNQYFERILKQDSEAFSYPVKGFIPCTPLGILVLLKMLATPIKGEEVTIIGRSRLVGLPCFLLMNAYHGSVHLCHSYSQHISKRCQESSIIIVATGQPELIKKTDVQAGSFVIDVGITRVEKQGRTMLVGDIESQLLDEKGVILTPVPKGVGPMTISMLMHNTLLAAYRAQGK